MRLIRISILFLIISVLPLIGVNQVPDVGDRITLYEYGGVTTSEDNLKNLFRNFPIYIDNGKDIDFLSYEFVGIIENKRVAKKYVQKNFDDLVPIGWSMIAPSDQDGDNSEFSSVTYHIQPIGESKSELKRMMKTISTEYIKTGDEVFVVKYVENLQRHEHYVFINPETKAVLLEGNIFGIKVPRAHMTYVEKKVSK